MEKKHTGVYVINYVEMQQLDDCKDLVSVQHELVCDVIDGMQTTLSRENPLFMLNSIRLGGVLQ